MATAETHGFTLDLSDRLATLKDLLACNPSCAVGLLDPARSIGNAEPALARVGISADGHVPLVGGALAQFLAVADVSLLSEAFSEANVHGSATRTVRLRDGRLADLHLVEIGGGGLTTVAVVVPGAGETVAGTPPPTAIAASSRIGVLVCDGYGGITTASASTLELLRRPTEPIDGTPVLSLLHPDDQEMAIVNWMAAKEQRGTALRWRCRVGRADGTWLWVEVTITNQIDSAGLGEVRFDLYDISTEVAATEALVAERELIGLLTETLPVGVAKFDAIGRVEHANGRLAELLAPLDPEILLAQAMRGELEDLDLAAAFDALRHEGTASCLVVDHVAEHQTVRHLEWTLHAAIGEHGEVTGGVVCIADVTESASLREALERRASTDALTACLNRAGAVAALEHALLEVGPTGGVGLLFIDLDDFKAINDKRGHAVGDAVLEVVATRLRGASRPGDLVGRLGGDEFVVIAPNIPSASAAFVLAGRVARQLHGPTVVNGVAVPIAASVGVAWASSSTASDLLGEADAAMYVAKHAASHLPVLSPGRVAA
jgi:diguanylate cyclase (GGDEF)-like protein